MGGSGVWLGLAVAVVVLVAFWMVEQRVARPMFDLTLFRTPTFTGGLIVAFTMNGSLFAMLLYLVLYLQDDLGYSALATGARLLVLSSGTLVSATISGRLTSRVPIRWLIGPGLVLVGVGLLLMSGLTGTTTWTHLVVGFILSGVGSGLVNPPLASTAVGVVRPERSGMASGVNATFRQIGISVGIALYGTIFASALQSKLDGSLATLHLSPPQLTSIVTDIKEGYARRVVQSVPASARNQVIGALHSSFAGSLDELLLVSGLMALLGALSAFILIRPKDFVAQVDAGHAG